MARASLTGTIYLLHFSAPFGHAKHYTGWTPGDLDERVELHEKGAGAKLTGYAYKAGVRFTVARTWTGDRKRERQLKKQGGAARHCPICMAQRRTQAC